MGFAEARQAIADRIAEVTGIEAVNKMPDTINPPVVVVIPAESEPVKFNTSSGSHDANVHVVLFLSDSVIRVAQDELDQYMNWDGEKSIYAALHGYRCQWFDSAEVSMVSQAGALGHMTHGVAGVTPTYMGAQFEVTVMVSV